MVIQALSPQLERRRGSGRIFFEHLPDDIHQHSGLFPRLETRQQFTRQFLGSHDRLRLFGGHRIPRIQQRLSLGALGLQHARRSEVEGGRRAAHGFAASGCHADEKGELLDGFLPQGFQHRFTQPSLLRSSQQTARDIQDFTRITMGRHLLAGEHRPAHVGGVSSCFQGEVNARDFRAVGQRLSQHWSGKKRAQAIGASFGLQGGVSCQAEFQGQHPGLVHFAPSQFL